MKRPSILMLITFLFGIFIVLALHIAAPKNENHKLKGFERVFAPDGILQPLDTLDLGYNSYYIAGIGNKNLFLGNIKAPAHIVEVRLNNLKDTIHHRIQAGNLQYKSLHIQINSPFFYLTDGTVPLIYRGKISDWKASPYLESPYFTNAIALNDGNLVFTGIHNLKTVFYKIQKEKIAPVFFPNLLKAQHGDGIFSTDGMLRYDQKTEHLIYLYYYRNQYLYMKTGFSLINEGNTIDTISVARIKVGELDSKNSLTMSKPPLRVNNQCYTLDNYLHVNSNILAKNEDSNLFENSSVIDLYRLDLNKYLLSYYIPTFGTKNLDEFIITENQRLLVRYGQFVLIFKLNIEKQLSKNIIAQ